MQYTVVVDKLPKQDRPRAMDVRERMLVQQKKLSLGLVHTPEVDSPHAMDVINSLRQHQDVDENTFMAIVGGIKGVALERDFTTTNGTQGSLRCPFSKSKGNQSALDTPKGKDDLPHTQIEDGCGHEHADPIIAEQHERRSSQSLSAHSSTGRCPASRCPIRFLDQHSPEEIAEYVERHKHEIPRSHTICVKRYQRDPQNMRQLDAKYGGMPSMIRGLGVKHQAFLPHRQANGDEEEEGDGQHSTSPEHVEKWAEDVHPVTPGPQNEDENRQSHFDRPLREVRVGESPSRPWGIPVPIAHKQGMSVPFSGSVSGPKSTDPQFKTFDPMAHNSAENHDEAFAKPAGRCPFGHGAPQPTADAAIPKKPENKPDDAAVADAPRAEETVKSDTTSPAHVTFNGPVFFGYSAEQTARLMQQMQQLGHFQHE